MKTVTRNSVKTKFIGPTNYRQLRIAASCDGRRIVVPYDHAATCADAHAEAARAWLEKYIPGATLDPNGLCHLGDYYWAWTY